MEQETWRGLVTIEMGTGKTIPGKGTVNKCFLNATVYLRFPLLRKCLISTKKRRFLRNPCSFKVIPLPQPTGPPAVFSGPELLLITGQSFLKVGQSYPPSHGGQALSFLPTSVARAEAPYDASGVVRRPQSPKIIKIQKTKKSISGNSEGSVVKESALPLQAAWVLNS